MILFVNVVCVFVCGEDCVGFGYVFGVEWDGNYMDCLWWVVDVDVWVDE